MMSTGSTDGGCEKRASPWVDGRSNAQIAEALFLSARTVERHLSNIYAKLDLEGKAARAAAAARVSRANVRRQESRS